MNPAELEQRLRLIRREVARLGHIVSNEHELAMADSEKLYARSSDKPIRDCIETTRMGRERIEAPHDNSFYAYK